MERDVNAKEVANLGATVRHEINLMYVLSLACDAMIFDIEKRMKRVDRGLHLKNEAKMRLRQYLRLLSDCEANFEHFVAPTIIGSAARNDDGFGGYERSRQLAQEIIRLVMMYYEKCSPLENHIKVFDMIGEMDGGRGVFMPEDINNFDLGCK